MWPVQLDTIFVIGLTRSRRHYTSESVHVELQAVGLLQFKNVLGSLPGRPPSLRFDDRVQLLLDVRGHLALVAADENLGAVLHPRVEVARLLVHAVLHVDLVGLVAREREIDSHEPAFFPRRQLRLVVVAPRARLIAEEEPVLSGRAGGVAFLEEGAERREPRAGT